MGRMNHVMLYCAYERELSAYSYEQIGRMLMGLVHYVNTGEEYEPKGAERYIWPTLFDQLLRNLENYEEKCAVNRANSEKAAQARKRKRTQKTPVGTDGIPIDGNENENEKENEKEKESVNENVPDRGADTNTLFSPPDADSVLLFCREEGLEYVDARRFVDYYGSVGWVVGGKPMRDWKAVARLWNERDKTKGTKEEMNEHYSAAARYGVLL